MKTIFADRHSATPMVLPLLIATGTLGLLAIVWRQRAAPRAERSTTTKRDAPEQATRVAERHERGPDAQSSDEGAGPLVHRRYEIELPDRTMSSDMVLRLMQLHLKELAPAALAEFEKSSGSENVFGVGDEYEITMLGPWNGAVRVSEVTRNSFTLVTLDGHPEAGHITFSVEDGTISHGLIGVRIESWARSRDGLVAAAYDTLKVGKQVQTEVWITFLQRLAELAGVSTRPEVRITTESHEERNDGKTRDA